jgi:toxin ParE1/3/4
MRIRWTRRAAENLQSIFEYIAADNREAAEKIARKVHDTVQGLQQFPKKGRPGWVEGTRELVVSKSPYIIVYRDVGDVIEILRVLHTSRKYP